MDILIIPSWYMTAPDSLLGIFFKEQALALQKKGHNVRLIYPEFHQDKKIFKKGIFVSNEDDIITYRYKQNYNPRLQNKRILFVKNTHKLYKKLIKEGFKPDVIHAHSVAWGGYAGAYISKKYDVPLVITEHSSEYARGMISLKKLKYIKKALIQSSKVIVVGKYLEKEMKRYVDSEKVSLIPNIVDIEKFKLSSNHLKDNKFRFFSLGLLSKIKGVDLLLKAYAKILENKSLQNSELLIGGDGDEKSNLEKLAKSLNILKNVKFLGMLNREEVANQMQSCNAFVLPSRFETFGIVYIEALASGKPVIATKCGGPELFVNQSNGFLVPVEDIDALSIAMIKMMELYKEFNPKELRQYCVNQFSEEVVVKQIEDLYNHIINK